MFGIRGAHAQVARPCARQTVPALTTVRPERGGANRNLTVDLTQPGNDFETAAPSSLAEVVLPAYTSPSHEKPPP
jgi:hypothetical protein